MKTKLFVGNLSDVGKKRTANEDYFGSYKGSYGELIIVCDGMGGNKGGALASRLAVETIKQHFDSIGSNFEPKAELNNALLKADNVLKEKSLESDELKEMGSTAVILLIKDNMAYTAHIGDSRIYMIRKGEIHQLTKDHSLVQQMIDAKIITEEAAKEHPQKNVITRSLGADGSSQPETSEPFALFKKDIFILCSDGLTAYVEDKELLQVCTTQLPQNACHTLITLANERGGKDNITIQIASVVKGKRLPVPNPLKNKNFVQVLTVSLAVILFAFVFYLVEPYKIFLGNDEPDKNLPADSSQIDSSNINLIKQDADSLMTQDDNNMNDQNALNNGSISTDDTTENISED